MTKSRIQLHCALLAALLMVGCAPQKHKNLTLVWADEFDYKGLPDTQRWNFDTIGNAYAWGNNELQHYTVAQQKNARANGEVLQITALK